MASKRVLDQGNKGYELARPDQPAILATLQPLDDMEARRAVLVFGGLVGAGQPPTPEDLLRDADTRQVAVNEAPAFRYS